MEFILFWLSLFSLVFAQSSFSPAKPPSIPLAVRSPYMSTYQPAGSDGGNGGYLAGQWPSFWNGAVTGWTGLIQVDGKTYTWMGNPSPLPAVVTQTAFSYTSTRSIFTMNVAGLVTMEITFLSPITPLDMLRQSFPITYMNVAVHSADGKKHTVSLYTDISAEWTSGDRNQAAQWSYGTLASGYGNLAVEAGSENATIASASQFDNDASAASPGTAYHKVFRQQQQQFAETNDQASWGNWYYSTSNVAGLTHQSGADVDVRGQFTSHGRLANTADTNYRAINQDYPVFGYSVALGSVGTTPVQTLFSISLLQQNGIQFTSKAGSQAVPSYWTSLWKDELKAMSFFHNDFNYVSGRTTSLDSAVVRDSNAAAGANYAMLTQLAARQAWGGVTLCGTPSQPYIFLKEISSDGNIQTVDVIFPFQPILLYFNPSWMKLLLDPLFIDQETPNLWPEQYSIHDLGEYPNAPGHPNGVDEYMPLEESANMLIMTLAHAQKTGDTSYLNQHYTLLNRWTEWLINNNSVIPFSQISTDDFAGSLANQTNLALKAIIGVQAGSLIATMTGHKSDSTHFAQVAKSWVSTWQKLGIASHASPPHSTLSYGDTSSFSLLYNLYADALLETKLFPTSVYQMQSNFYPTVKQQYGVPLDTRHLYTKNDWELYCAAIAAPATRDMFISDIANWMKTTSTSGPVTDLYQTTTGTYAVGGPTFKNRPVVGGWFSLLALNHTGIPQQ